MAVLPDVKYEETCRVLAALGYDPSRIRLDTVTQRGFEEFAPGDGLLACGWSEPGHWPKVEAAMSWDWRMAKASTPPTASADPVNHPSHYTSDPSGVECITITRHRSFNVGNAIKYLWRAGLKSDVGRDPVEKQIEDLRKAVWYLNDEIALLKGATG